MPPRSVRQPTLFIPHGGGPCFFMDWNPPDAWLGLQRFLESLAHTLPAAPDAVVVVSAHWEAADFTVNTGANPPLLYDYYGFPAHTYALRYAAPGAPALAGRVADLLGAAGLSVRSDRTRGFDHGVFIPFKLIFAHAEVPIVQLSLREGLDPATHLAAGRALAPLRDDNVLIVGSGMSYHNLRAFGAAGAEAAQRFDGWLRAAVSQGDVHARSTALCNWQQAPAARAAHPREEHLLPLMVAAGAGGDDAGRIVFNESVLGMPLSACRFG